jgi:hypothetical protein
MFGHFYERIGPFFKSFGHFFVEIGQLDNLWQKFNFPFDALKQIYFR